MSSNPAAKEQRATVRFSQKAMADLKELQDLLGEASLGAVIRRAIQTELLLAREAEGGRKIYTADSKGREVRQLMM